MSNLLTMYGLKMEPVAYGTEWAHRAELHRRLRGVFPESPLKPMPHGSSVGSLWTLFPYEFRATSVDVWIERLRKGNKWIAVPDSPLEPVSIVEESVVLGPNLPNVDLYLLATDGSDDVLALDHEGEGPWWSPGDTPRQPSQRRKRNTVPTLASPHAERLNGGEVRKVQAWVRKTLDDRTYFPRYLLAASGAAADSTWNYLQAYKADIGPDSISLELLERAELLLIWSDRKPSEMWRTPGGAVDWSNWPKVDTNILEWPKRRWLMSVPGEFLLTGEESWAKPCLVVF
jgi:hypothetical protein